MLTLLHSRLDGTFVIQRNGHPYHVTKSDPLFQVVAAAAYGVDLPVEPILIPPTTPLPAPQPTSDQLMARLLQIQRQIEALSA